MDTAVDHQKQLTQKLEMAVQQFDERIRESHGQMDIVRAEAVKVDERAANIQKKYKVVVWLY